MTKTAKKMQVIEGIIEYAGEEIWTKRPGWHWRIKLATGRPDRVIQLDCYNQVRNFASGMVFENGEFSRRPEMALRQGDRVEARTKYWTNEVGVVSKKGQKYNRLILKLNEIKELKVIMRNADCPAPSSFDSPKDSNKPSPT